MKLTIILSLFLIFLSCEDRALDVPETAKQDFENRFSGANDVQWSADGDGFEAEFKSAQGDASVTYDNKGSWTETEQAIPKNALPESVTLSVTNQYPGFRIEKAEIIETPTIKAYEVTIQQENSTIELVIDGTGTILKTKKSGKEDDDDEEEDEDK